mmetsp:Transcript_10294/g.43806  ORF Transcript_10294/g.43806 Transcript_10294/m.43806 type:complete len:346 (+) Transcript_10294:505-1542(+)
MRQPVAVERGLRSLAGGGDRRGGLLALGGGDLQRERARPQRAAPGAHLHRVRGRVPRRSREHRPEVREQARAIDGTGGEAHALGERRGGGGGRVGLRHARVARQPEFTARPRDVRDVLRLEPAFFSLPLEPRAGRAGRESGRGGAGRAERGALRVGVGVVGADRLMYSVVGARGEARDGPERVRRLLRVERRSFLSLGVFFFSLARKTRVNAVVSQDGRVSSQIASASAPRHLRLQRAPALLPELPARGGEAPQRVRHSLGAHVLRYGDDARLERRHQPVDVRGQRVARRKRLVSENGLGDHSVGDHVVSACSFRGISVREIPETRLGRLKGRLRRRPMRVFRRG